MTPPVSSIRHRCFARFAILIVTAVLLGPVPGCRRRSGERLFVAGPFAGSAPLGPSTREHLPKRLAVVDPSVPAIHFYWHAGASMGVLHWVLMRWGELGHLDTLCASGHAEVRYPSGRQGGFGLPADWLWA